MRLLDNVIAVGPKGISLYRRWMGENFSLVSAERWGKEPAEAYVRRATDQIGAEVAFDLVLEKELSVLTTHDTSCLSRDRETSYADGFLVLTGRDLFSHADFSLVIGTDILLEVVHTFGEFKSRLQKVIICMPSKSFRTYVYLDGGALAARPDTMADTMRSSLALFVPYLESELEARERSGGLLEYIPKSVRQTPVLEDLTAPSAPASQPSAPRQADTEIVPTVPTEPACIDEGFDFAKADSADEPEIPAPSAEASEPIVLEPAGELTLLLPISDDLGAAFLAFGYSVACGRRHRRVLEVGALRRSLISSYSRLVGRTEVVDVPASGITMAIRQEIDQAVRQLSSEERNVLCFIGSEVLSPELLEIFKETAATLNLKVKAVACSAAEATGGKLDHIMDAFDISHSHLEMISFLPVWGVPGFHDAKGKIGRYFGVPSVEGHTMIRCMEQRLGQIGVPFAIPKSVPSRDALALERYIAAFDELVVLACPPSAPMEQLRMVG